MGGVLEVVTLLDAPHGFTWQGLYLDAAGTPVRGVEVRFAVKAGGAMVSRPSLSSWQPEVPVKTDYDGIARMVTV